MKTIRKTFMTRPRANSTMSLQITSMADVFMILLVFLLKSYGNGTIDVTPSQGVALPKAIPGAAPVDGVKLEIAEGTIRVDGKPVARIDAFAFKQADLASTGASRSLSAALEDRKKDKTAGSRVIIVADERAPYSTIKTVLASAAVTGFTDFKLAVVNPN